MVPRRALLGLMASLGIAGAAKAAPQPGTDGISASGGVLAAGVHDVPHDLTVTGDLALLPGATIRIATGRTLTLRGGFTAPIAAIFTGPGRVDMLASRVPEAYPEWWGAKTGDGIFDNLTPLNACLAAHRVVRLQCADYFIPDTWRITTSHRTIRGAGKNWRGPGTATRLIVERPRASVADVVRIGPDVSPGSVNDYTFTVELSGVHLTRDGLVEPSSADPRGAATGIRLQWCHEVRVDDVSIENHAIGIYVGGAVHCFITRSTIQRSHPATRSEGDFFWGIYLDGEVPSGFAGGNASIYVDHCAVLGPGLASSTRSIATYLKGAFADSFLAAIETAGCQVGIRVEGLARYAGPRRDLPKSGNGNLHITRPILDQVHHGIELLDLSDQAIVDVEGGYVAMARGGIAALSVVRCAGQISVMGGQLIGWDDAEHGGRAQGLRLIASQGLTTRGLKLLGFAAPAVLEGCSGFDLDLSINNPAQKVAGPAIRLAGCARGTLRPQVRGMAGAFQAGVLLAGDDNRFLEIAASGIDPDAVTRGANAKVLVSAAGAPSNGRAGTNLITGIVD